MLIVSALAVLCLAHATGILFGRHVLRMHPGILLGTCAGAGASGPALAAIQEVAESKIPTLGYGVSYAIGNVLLALWGNVIVGLLA
jgi:putative transport protein